MQMVNGTRMLLMKFINIQWQQVRTSQTKHLLSLIKIILQGIHQGIKLCNIVPH